MFARYLVAMSVVISVLFSPGLVRAGSADLFEAALNQHMPDWLEKYAVPGAVVAYIKNGEVAWTQAYGLANLTSGAPMRPDMVFNHGSDGKVLTAWGVMRLVDLGLVDLDAPVNRYLKRWQLRSDEFDPDNVTLRRLLSHTAGLTVHGFNDYGPRRALPGLVDMLEGRNQLDGAVTIAWPPGTHFEYSGGGFVILQMVIEDVTGEPFAAFMKREITDPLGMASLQWTWTPELMARAPTPYGLQQEALEYRQLASQAIGSEISTVSDFARFVAAAVTGSAGEPVGRGVLRPETVRQMLAVQPNTNNTCGLGYGVSGNLLMHFGGNAGWNAHFVLETSRREGFVIANNSSHGNPFNLAVHYLWLDTVLGRGGGSEPLPVPNDYGLVAMAAQVITALLAASLLILVVRFAYELWAGRRRWTLPSVTRRIWPLLIWGALTFLWWYWFYTAWPLPFPTTFPDLWRLPQIDYVTGVLLAWCVYCLAALFFPRSAPQPFGVASRPIVQIERS